MPPYVIMSTPTGEVPSYWAFGRTWTLQLSDATRFSLKRTAELHVEDNKWHEQRQMLGHVEVLSYSQAKRLENAYKKGYQHDSH